MILTLIEKASEQHPLLRVLDSDAIRRLAAQSRLVRYRPKRTLLREGEASENAFLLLSGSVRVFFREGSSEILLKLFRAPALFGEMELMSKRSYLEHVVSLEACEVLLIPSTAFHWLLETQPQFARALATDLAARLCIAAHNIRACAFGDLKARVSHLLLDYAQLFGTKVPDGVRISLALSQEMMSKDLAVSRKAVNDTLIELRELGFVDKRDARYVLLSPEKLSELSTGTLSLTYDLAHSLPKEKTSSVA